MSREGDIQGISAGILTVAPGATLALEVLPSPGGAAFVLKYANGGSLEIVGAPPPPSNPQYSNYGTSIWAGSSLVALQGTGYMMGTAEAISFDGAARFYLICTGVTSQAYILRGLSSGY